MTIGLSTSVIQRGKTGVAQHLFALVRALLPYASRHQFVLFVLEEDLPLFAFCRERMELAPVPERFRPPLRNILWHQTRLPELARRYRLEVLHVPSYRRMLWPKPCKLVATIHDLAPFRLPGKYDWKRMLYARVVVRRLARRQDRIIAVSESTARDIATFFHLPPERVSVIHNGIEPDRFFPGDRDRAKAVVARQYGVPAPFFLYVARLEHPGKNHVRLIAAFEEFKAARPSNWQLVFGGSDWHGAEAIHRAIRQSPCAGDIRCLGFVPEADLPDLYRAAEVFVYPSLYEGFGLPPVEAMACGCPVIASGAGALAEVVGRAAAVVDPEDVHSLAQQLSALAFDGAARAGLRAAGLVQAQRFHWPRAALATLAAYTQA